MTGCHGVAGIPYVRVHDLRKTFTTRFVRSKVDIKTVQTLAGHKHTSTTLKYFTHASSAAMTRVAIEPARDVG